VATAAKRSNPDSLVINKNLMKVRKAVRKALELQRDRTGFSFVEILSPCPTIWNMTPRGARRWIEEKMLPVFPLGVLRDRKLESTQNAVPQTTGDKTTRPRNAGGRIATTGSSERGTS
jgi:pyruvate/2-oxoacid:ferredoxin oxidoreductase beta subunit